MIKGRSRWVSVGKEKTFSHCLKQEKEVETIKHAENWRSKRRKLK